MQSFKDLLKDKEKFTKNIVEKHKYVTQEFQDYGYRIAVKLGEQKRASLYIKLAKNKPRALLEQAFSFAIDYPSAKNRGRLFMWKLKELDTNLKEKRGESDLPKSKKAKKTDKPKKAKAKSVKKTDGKINPKTKPTAKKKSDKNEKSDIIQLLDI